MKKLALALAAFAVFATPAAAEGFRLGAGANGNDWTVNAERTAETNVRFVGPVTFGVEYADLDDRATYVGATATRRFSLPFNLTGNLVGGLGYGERGKRDGLAVTYGAGVERAVTERVSVGAAWRAYGGDVDEDAAFLTVSFR